MYSDRGTPRKKAVRLRSCRAGRKFSVRTAHKAKIQAAENLADQVGMGFIVPIFRASLSHRRHCVFVTCLRNA